MSRRDGAIRNDHQSDDSERPASPSSQPVHQTTNSLNPM